MDSNKELLTGFFTYCLFSSDNFGIYKFRSEEGNITVKGPLVGIDFDNQYILEGHFIHHSKFGLQFQVDFFKKTLPNKGEEALKLLCSPIFKGIGEKTAKKILSHFGESCLTLLKEDFSLTNELTLTKKQQLALKNGLMALENPLEELRIKLIKAGFNSSDLQIINTFYQNSLLSILKENPYRLFYEVDGIGFSKVDKFFLGEGFAYEDERRKMAILYACLSELTFKTGDSYVFEEEILSFYCKKTSFSDADEFLKKGCEEYLFYRDEERIYLYKDYYAEVFIADFLWKFQENGIEIDVSYLQDLLNILETRNGICYAEEQKQAIYSFFNHRLSMICGGPGTGKTTIIQALVSITKMIDSYQAIAITAPTGRAAKRIGELCDVSSQTIHSLLGWEKETNTFRYNENNPLLLDILIIDEFSMVDLQLFQSLLKACGAVKKICIIGDNHQLPSIRCGDVLRDLIISKICSTVFLKMNFRQKEGNEIVKLAKAIQDNNVTATQYQQDIHFIHIPQIASAYQKNLEKILEKYNVDDVQVLAPMYSGECGIDSLNHFLQNLMNEDIGQTSVKNGQNTYREGDKIIQLKNQSNDDIYNGDIGKIAEINHFDRLILVDFNEHLVEISFDNLDNIRLAYAISVHKSQGSEYPVIILCIHHKQRHMLDKKLLYTAVTRAKKEIYIVGDCLLFNEAIQLIRPERKTGLQQRIIDLRLAKK